jgi:hypothetical protein
MCLQTTDECLQTTNVCLQTTEVCVRTTGITVCKPTAAVCKPMAVVCKRTTVVCKLACPSTLSLISDCQVMPGSRWNFHACLQTHGSGLQTYGKTRWFANERKMFAKQGQFSNNP